MARPRSIDRDKLLDAAERIVHKVGPAGLTIDAVAQAAGVTKGGVQYCFGTKDQMIEALFRRWLAEFETCMERFAEGRNDPRSLVQAYVAAIGQTYRAANERSSVMLALLMQSEGRLEQCRQWYQEQFDRMKLTSGKQQRLRLAFLAAEGAFMLRCFGFAEIGDKDWQTIFHNIESILLE